MNLVTYPVRNAMRSGALGDRGSVFVALPARGRSGSTAPSAPQSRSLSALVAEGGAGTYLGKAREPIIEPLCFAVV